MSDQSKVSRRRFLKVVGAVGVAGASSSLPAFAASALVSYVWEGEALGSDVTIEVYGSSVEQAKQHAEKAAREIKRLEAMFSLYDASSELSRLNGAGALERPSPEFVELMHFSKEMTLLSNGAFDVTVQPLWQLYHDHFTQERAPAQGPDEQAVLETLKLVGSHQIEVTDQRVAYGKTGMAVTLNGVGQGFIADKVAAVMREAGVRHVLVNTGELVALGPKADKTPWRVGILNPKNPFQVGYTVGLADLALATSGAYGFEFDQEGRHHHLLDPRTGKSARENLSVSVSAPSAALADALSTSFSILPLSEIERLMQRYDRVGALVTRLDGTTVRLGAFPVNLEG